MIMYSLVLVVRLVFHRLDVVFVVELMLVNLASELRVVIVIVVLNGVPEFRQ